MIFSAIRVLAPLSRSWATVSSNDDRRSRLDGSGILGQAPTSRGGGVLLRLTRSLAGSWFRSGSSGWSRCGSAEQTVWRQRYNLSAIFPIFKQFYHETHSYFFSSALCLVHYSSQEDGERSTKCGRCKNFASRSSERSTSGAVLVRAEKSDRACFAGRNTNSIKPVAILLFNLILQ